MSLSPCQAGLLGTQRSAGGREDRFYEVDVQEDEKRAPDIVPGDRAFHDSDHGVSKDIQGYRPQVALQKLFPPIPSLGCFPALLAIGLLPLDLTPRLGLVSYARLNSHVDLP